MCHPRRRNHRLLTGFLTACLMLGGAGVSSAQAQDEDLPPHDVRVYGYQLGDNKVGPQVIAKPRGTSSAWALLALVGVVCVGVTFKAGKRTHLD